MIPSVRKLIVSASFLVVLFLLNACGGTKATKDTLATNSTLASPSSPKASPPICAAGDLAKQFEEIARVTKGPVGTAAMLVETGEVVAFNGKQHFPMQSVYKLPIGMATLHQVDRGALTLDQKLKVRPEDLAPQGLRSALRDKYPGGVDLTVRELLRFMMVDSDGTACDVLLTLLGGPTRVTSYLRELHVAEIVVATSEKEMAENDDVQYRNWSTPEAMVGLLKLLQEGGGLSSASRELLLEFMRTTWTFPGRIKGALPPGTIVAHKTGSSGTRNGLSRATNDVGLISLPDGNHLAVAVFVSDTKADEITRDAVIAKIARAAWDCWTVPVRK